MGTISVKNRNKKFDFTTLAGPIFVEHQVKELHMFRFYIPKMTCGGCARSVTKALLSVDPQALVETDPAAREAMVYSNSDESAFLAVLKEAGYPDER